MLSEDYYFSTLAELLILSYCFCCTGIVWQVH